MTTTVSTKGQIVLPASFRTRDKIRSGQRFKVERLEPGRYLLEKVGEPRNEGVVEWLLACPVKGFFEPIPSESTASL